LVEAFYKRRRRIYRRKKKRGRMEKDLRRAGDDNGMKEGTK